MGRNARGHANGDARTPIEEKEGELCGEDRWFLLRPIEVRCKVDGVITDFFQQSLMGNRGQTRFGVTHRGWRIVINRSEIAMSIQKRMSASKGLNQSYECVVDRLISVGMVFPENITNDTGAFSVGTIWG